MYVFFQVFCEAQTCFVTKIHLQSVGTFATFGNDLKQS